MISPLRLSVVVTAISVAAALSNAVCFGSPSTNGGHMTPPPSSSSKSAPVKIAFVTNNMSDYWLIALSGVNEAQKELGSSRYKVQFIAPCDGTVELQEANVEAAIASGVKEIAISPIDATKEAGWLNKIAREADVITQDSDAPLSNRLAYIGTDNHAAGVLAGEYIKKALPHGGKIDMFVGNRSAQNAHDREQGIRDALQGSNVQVLDVIEDGTDRTLATKNAADALTAHPDLAMEVGLWSYNGPAIELGVEQTHNVGKVKIVCFDQEIGTLIGVRSGAIYATVVQQPYQFGYHSVMLLAQLAAGNRSGLPSSRKLYYPTVAVTHSTVDKYIAELDKETGKSWGPAN